MRNESPGDKAFSKMLAADLTKRYRGILFWVSGGLLILGCVHGYISESATVLPRYGALVTLLTLWHAYAQSQYLKMFELDVIPIASAFAKEIGKEDRAELLPDLMGAIQRRFILDHLTVATTGTVVWGFGDLLPLF
ncbi:hypothetical protein BCY90_17425 [Agrobacterium deltaense]|uniref:hypothetical protein n=1 Tax=Agrobacterium TaxID=357 RepID=UPI0007459BF2|nr:MULTISPECIES: hypothetical protein [Agrobacterium]KVK43571.1 hypothetical protein L901_26385 [Agrobacterium sp. D14]RKF41585.1 hypothetical protein BCY90_17425 [Agrobacterium deltaense]